MFDRRNKRNGEEKYKKRKDYHRQFNDSKRCVTTL